MSVERIPVFLSHHSALAGRDPIGFGRIENDELVITISQDRIVADIDHLAHAGQISELYLGLAFPVAPGVNERTRP